MKIPCVGMYIQIVGTVEILEPQCPAFLVNSYLQAQYMNYSILPVIATIDDSFSALPFFGPKQRPSRILFHTSDVLLLAVI